MKLEINIDESFLENQSSSRSLSFSRFLDSFRHTTSSIFQETSKRYPSEVIDNKLIGGEFALSCGIPIAKTLQLWEGIDKIAFAPKTVVKPVSGSSSKGVFIVYSEDNIVYLNRKLKFSNVSDAKNYARKLIEDNVIRRDRWMSEELLVNSDSIARDVKFYVFYGKVGLILETERANGIKRCWFDQDLNYVDTGKYSNNLFKADRDFLQELTSVVESLSLEIPTPFVRIDLLISGDDYYLGEFTPVPANYDSFTKKWDSQLGEFYADAMVRLCHDIGLGKKFLKFAELDKSWTSTLKSIRSRI